MADPTIQDLLLKNADLFAAHEKWTNSQIMLLAGTADDPDSFSAAGDKTPPLGYYPVTNVNGQTIYVPCLARLHTIAAGAADPAVLENLLSDVTVQAQSARDAAATVGTLGQRVLPVRYSFAVLPPAQAISGGCAERTIPFSASWPRTACWRRIASAPRPGASRRRRWRPRCRTGSSRRAASIAPSWSRAWRPGCCRPASPSPTCRQAPAGAGACAARTVVSSA